MPSETEPSRAALTKFLAAVGVPAEDAKPFLRTVHEDLAPDLAELVHQRAVAAYFGWECPLQDFIDGIPALLDARGIGHRKLSRPKKGVPAGGEWQAYHLELSADGSPPVRPLLLWQEGPALPYLRTLDTALQSLGARLYTGVCQIDGDFHRAYLFREGDWDRVGGWLGTDLRDRLFLPIDQVPDTDDERLALQWKLWTGRSKRPKNYRIWSERQWKGVRLSRPFLEEHRAAFDAIGVWEEGGAMSRLEVGWKRPPRLDHSWVPLDLELSVESHYERQVGCGVGRFDPTPGMMNLLRLFLDDQAKHLAAIRAVVATWGKKAPKWAVVEISRWGDGDHLSVAVQFTRKRETNPESCSFDPETGEWE